MPENRRMIGHWLRLDVCSTEMITSKVHGAHSRTDRILNMGIQALRSALKLESSSKSQAPEDFPGNQLSEVGGKEV